MIGKGETCSRFQRYRILNLRLKMEGLGLIERRALKWGRTV